MTDNRYCDTINVNKHEKRDTLKVNYHTHTALCRHATGEMKDYVEKAIEAGIKKLGFADHAVQFYDGDFVSGIRMRPDQAEWYVKEAKRLSEEYKNDIQIYVGFEAEYFPSIFHRLQSFCRDNGVDYLIMGQHCLTYEPTTELWGGAGTSNPALLKKYVDEVLEGLSTGSFTYICHPDMFRFTGDDDVYNEEFTRLCKGAKSYGVPLEINLLGLRHNRHYPTDRLFSLAQKEGCSFIIGCDSHSPETLIDKKGPALAEEFVARNKITLLSDIELKKL